jgi:hypothetical protein
LEAWRPPRGGAQVPARGGQIRRPAPLWLARQRGGGCGGGPVLAPTWWRTNGGPDRISCYLKTGKSLSASVVELPSTSPLPPRVPRRRGTPVLPLSSLLFPCPFLGGFISEPAPSPFRCRCSSLPAMQHTTTTTRRSTTWLRPGGVPGAVEAGGSWDGVPGAVVARRWWAGPVLGFFSFF